MGPPFVVIATPSGDNPPGFEQVLEPADAKALLTQLAVETLHVGILRGLARLDVNQIDLAIQRPGKEVAALQLRAIVTTYGPWQTALGDDLVKHPGYAHAREACIHFHGKALAGVRIDDVQHADRAATS